MPKEITGHEFIQALTSRATTTAMPKDELLHRLDIILGTLSQEQATPKQATNALRGALIRLTQAYHDQQVTEKIDALVAITTDITGI